jgi:acetylornithine deacetylase/succinyl-diaminopimelate desuccinylase-like protein
MTLRKRGIGLMDPLVGRALEVIDRRFDEFLGELMGYLRQPGVSSTGEGIPESVELTVAHLRRLCGDDVRVVSTEGHPVILGKAQSGVPAAKTLLLYCFYDVVPADGGEWRFPPFEPSVVDASALGLPSEYGAVLSARGSIDHRGPLLGAVSALLALREAAGDLPLNVVFVVEGEEEIGSNSLPPVVEEYQEYLGEADAFWFPRMGREAPGAPMMVHRGYAGGLELELTSRSGEWGGSLDGHDLFGLHTSWVDAPLWRMLRAVASLVDDEHRIAIDGFWEHVREMDGTTSKQLEALLEHFDEDQARQSLGIGRFRDGHSGRELYPAYVMEPRLDLKTGVLPGLPGEESYTLDLLTGARRAELAMRARSRIRFSVTPDLDEELIIDLLRAHLDRRGFTEIDIQTLNGYGWSRTETSDALYGALEQSCSALEIPYLIWPGSFSGAPFDLFNRAPLSLPMIAFGAGHGGRFHEVDEYITIDGYREFMHLTASWLHEWAARSSSE